MLCQFCQPWPSLRHHWTVITRLSGNMAPNPEIYREMSLQQTPVNAPTIGQCWPTIYNAGPTLNQHCYWFADMCWQDRIPGRRLFWWYITNYRLYQCWLDWRNIITSLGRHPSKQLNVDTRLVWCWSTVYDAGPTSNQHCVRYLE